MIYEVNVTERTVRQRPKYKPSTFVKLAQQVLISFIRQIYDILQISSSFTNDPYSSVLNTTAVRLPT